MKTQPILLDELEVIGYADTLPGGKGPAVVPPVFRYRARTESCVLPPFRIVGEWLIGSQSVSFAEVQELMVEERVTLPNGLSIPTSKDHQLWIDEDGVVHYEPSGKARGNLRGIHLHHLRAGITALGKGEIDIAQEHAGIALAADDKALEPRALIAACYALRGQGMAASFMGQSVEQAGLNPESFTLLVKNYAESVIPSVWEHSRFDVELVLGTCKSLGVEIWIPFHFTEEEYERFRPILHQFRRTGGERQLIVSCTGVEAILLSERQTLQIAYDNAEAHIQKRRQTNVFAVAAETMLHGTSEIADKCEKSSELVQKLGRLIREQLQESIVGTL